MKNSNSFFYLIVFVICLNSAVYSQDKHLFTNEFSISLNRTLVHDSYLKYSNALGFGYYPSININDYHKILAGFEFNSIAFEVLPSENTEAYQGKMSISFYSLLLNYRYSYGEKTQFFAESGVFYEQTNYFQRYGPDIAFGANIPVWKIYFFIKGQYKFNLSKKEWFPGPYEIPTNYGQLIVGLGF